MTRKTQTKAKDNSIDPLENVNKFDPEELEKPDGAILVGDKPVSPLGPPASIAGTELSSMEILLLEANKRIEQLQLELSTERKERRELEKKQYQLEATLEQAKIAQKELEQGREARIELERKVASMETEMKHARELAKSAENDRAARIELERKVGSLEIQAEKAAEQAEKLAKTQEALIELERANASLQIEVQHAKKLDALLTEERQARANAQMRASTAEAKLGQIENEKASQDRSGKKSFWGRGS